MIKFIKESIRDFKHVVWPTNKETKKYFGMVLTVLIIFGVYLFIANTLFSESLYGLKEVLTSEPTNNYVEDINIIENTGALEDTNTVENIENTGALEIENIDTTIETNENN